MRMLNGNNDSKIDEVSIFLTKDEAIQMVDYLQGLIDSSNSHHAHLSSDDYQKEITLCIYDNKNIDTFHPRIKKLILEDE